MANCNDAFLDEVADGKHLCLFAAGLTLLPAAEELLFRAGMIGALSRRLRPALAVTSTAAFALTHLLNYERGERRLVFVTPQLAFGSLFAALYLRRGLAAAIGAHTLTNVTLSALALAQKRHALHS